MPRPEVNTFPSLADIADRLRLSPDQRLALFIGAWTCDELPLIESEAQYEAYAAEEKRIRLENWDGRKETFGQYSRSDLGRYTTALAARMIRWEMRLVGTRDE